MYYEKVNNSILWADYGRNFVCFGYLCTIEINLGISPRNIKHIFFFSNLKALCRNVCGLLYAADRLGDNDLRKSSYNFRNYIQPHKCDQSDEIYK